MQREKSRKEERGKSRFVVQALERGINFVSY